MNCSQKLTMFKNITLPANVNANVNDGFAHSFFCKILNILLMSWKQF